jgi:hypothetical protein
VIALSEACGEVCSRRQAGPIEALFATAAYGCAQWEVAFYLLDQWLGEWLLGAQ